MKTQALRKQCNSCRGKPVPMQLGLCELNKHPRSQHISCNLIGFQYISVILPCCFNRSTVQTTKSFIINSSLHFNTEDMGSVTCKELVAKDRHHLLICVLQNLCLCLRSLRILRCLAQQPSLVYHVCDRCNYSSWYNVY